MEGVHYRRPKYRSNMSSRKKSEDEQLSQSQTQNTQEITPEEMTETITTHIKERQSNGARQHNGGNNEKHG